MLYSWLFFVNVVSLLFYSNFQSFGVLRHCVFNFLPLLLVAQSS